MHSTECLITYIFSVSPKFRTCYITGQCGEFTVKIATLYLHKLSWHFIVVFHQTFLSFSFLFLISSELPQQNINQSETGIGIINCQWNCMICMKIFMTEKIQFKFLKVVLKNKCYCTFPGIPFRLNIFFFSKLTS